MSFFNKLLKSVVKASASSKRKPAVKKINPKISASPRNVLEQNKERYSILNKGFETYSLQDSLNRIEYLKIEQRELESTLKRHSQIINESLRIISTTKNIEIIKSRYLDILENYDITIKYKNLGYTIDVQENFTQDLDNAYNSNLCRIAEIKVNEYGLKINSLKTNNAKDNATKKIYIFINEVKNSFKKSKNTEEALNFVEGLNDKIEDIYS